MARSQISEMLGDVIYESVFVSGEGVVQVSGAEKLHDIVVTKAVSGLWFGVWDASSGAVLSAEGTLKGKVYCGQDANPFVVPFDCRLNSGLAIVVSGNIWLIASYK